jgi:hypothetical protein
VTVLATVNLPPVITGAAPLVAGRRYFLFALTDRLAFLRRGRETAIVRIDGPAPFIV